MDKAAVAQSTRLVMGDTSLGAGAIAGAGMGAACEASAAKSSSNEDITSKTFSISEPRCVELSWAENRAMR